MVFLTTPRRNSPELVVKTTLNGVTQAYEINFNKGTIEPTSLSRAQTRESRAANVVFTTTELIPGDAASGIYRERPVTESPFSSFKSDRSKAIANVFVQHLELDDPAIKQQAQGQTTLDELQGGPKPLSEFLLNLIPFRSAIVNFQKGNYGEGAFDLTLDVFGFLTAGAATAGKLIKIGSSALSAGAKVLKAGKVIGAATIGVLNPLSGFGDLAKGGARLVSNGAKLVYAKGVDVVNKLRGASGSYDLLKAASKSNGVAATGTFKFADQTVEGGAALQNNKWYALDPITQRPYGPPLQDFIPATIAGNGVINSNLVNWLSAVIAPNAKTPNLAEVFRETLERVKTNHSTGFSKGYDAKGADATKGLENVPGYYPSMRLSDLKELAISTGRNPQEIGLLTKLIENRQATKSLEDAGIFSKEVAAAGGKATGMPQNLYLAQSDLASAGECAALANTMALAIQHGAQDVLIANFFKAASSAVTPGSRAFRKQLSDMHKTLRVNFHGTQAVSQVAYTDIVNRLSNATTTTIFKISTQNHGLLAGVTIKNNNKEWFFFDPNFGVATFATEDAMRRGLETTLNSGRSASTLSPIAVTNGVPTYHVSTFADGDFLTSVPYSNPFALFNAPL
ncbi:hypothetical protein LRS56_11090 [Pseudomonas poae]|nr:hypothetical protein LRS56_11090 [Pseudomonas poae]